MRSLPTGTVAFLMTDIEGSTRLISQVGDAFPKVLDDHLTILDASILAHGGTLVSAEGDSVFAVFPSAREAVAAAVAAQRGLAAHSWPAGVSLGVRIGVHVGEAVLGGRDYTGIDVHRTARVMAAGHGGQILATEAARDLALGGGFEANAFRDLGRHSLRDLPKPEHLYQVLAPGLEPDFPPLRSLTPAIRTPLPTILSGFVGRRNEMGHIRQVLGTERLVTLAGSGGTGKTRLAIETARGLADHYPDGTSFVALEALHDPALVLPAIAGSLGVAEQPGRSIAVVLGDYLTGRRVLVVLDNLEQVIEAAQDISRLLASAPGLTILATSREPLAIDGEHVVHVSPLDLPSASPGATVRDVATNEAVELFVERAQAARSDFVLSDANAAAVAAICRRLDGLPLAIELAAARTNLLTPEQIVARLGHRLALLAASRRDLPERQRTLRGAIDWSYELLTTSEQAFFRRMSVFSDGAELEAILAVVDPDGSLGADPLELEAALVDRSLLRLRRVGARNRVDMLETIREYATEYLAATPEDERDTRARHAAYYRDLAVASQRAMTDTRGDELFDRLDQELPNLRGAIAWSIESGSPETGLQIAAALGGFWHVRNHLLEGRRVIDDTLAASANDQPTATRLQALTIGSGLAAWQSDYRRGHELAEQALGMAEALGDRRQVAMSLMGLGWAEIGGDPVLARDRYTKAEALGRELGDSEVLFGALQGIALTSIRLGDLEMARHSALEAQSLGEASGDRYGTALNLLSLGLIEARDGDLPAGGRWIGKALRQLQASGGNLGLSIALDVLATLRLESGEQDSATRLAAAAERLRREVGGGPSTAIILLEEPLDRARRTMNPADFDLAVAAGRAMATDEVVVLALEIAETGLA